jgi:protein arginine kinase activator
MICQNCQQRQATVHLTEIDGAAKKEVHLCEPCASSQGDPANGPGVLEKLQSLLTPGARAGAELAQTTCADCGISYANFRARGRFGCPACYEAFRSGVDPLLDKIHGSTQHIGKVPIRLAATLEAAERLRELRTSLASAVQQEQYERAAELRDAIKQLEGANGSD